MRHLSVLLDEAVQALIKNREGFYLDCTFGRGGHSQAILRQLHSAGRLLAIDRDIDAIESGKAALLQKDERFTLKHSCFSELEKIVERAGWVGRVDGVLMDLGVSSPQLDNPSRGFSFLKDGPLDMRMDISTGLSARQWLAEVDEQNLVRVLFDYGEERYARRIARAIVQYRREKAIDSTLQLATLIENAIPVRDKYKHPATRSFQAIRIAVNKELDELKQALEQAVNILKPGGRLVVISFHSLEDRIVKRFIRDQSRGRYHAQARLPLPDRQDSPGHLIKIGKIQRAGVQEIGENPRARSAVMRVAERTVF